MIEDMIDNCKGKGSNLEFNSQKSSISSHLRKIFDKVNHMRTF